MQYQSIPCGRSRCRYGTFLVQYSCVACFVAQSAPIQPSLHLQVKSMEQTPLPAFLRAYSSRAIFTFMVIIAFANTVIATSIVRAFVQARFSSTCSSSETWCAVTFSILHVPRPPHLFGQHFNGATPFAGHVSFEQSSPSHPCTHSQHFFGPHLPWPEQPLGQTFTAQVLPV